ncbi:MAG: hypothetical protein ACE5GQ_08960 [Nitrospinales bacterium]
MIVQVFIIWVLLCGQGFAGSIKEPDPSEAYAWEIAKGGGAVLAYHMDGRDVAFAHQETALRQQGECGVGMYFNDEEIKFCFGGIIYFFAREASHYRLRGGEWIAIKDELNFFESPPCRRGGLATPSSI